MKTKLNPTECITRLTLPEGRLRMVLDTDTYNEVDDQFALMYALASPERLQVEAIYAAPFTNDRSDGPADGMEKSYKEIIRLLETASQVSDKIQASSLPVLKGSTSYLPDANTYVPSDAAEDLVQRAMASSSSDPLYVAAIGAITNIASAILMQPEIIRRMVVVWLGGHALHWSHTREFNLHQDIAAAQVLFNSGVPLVHIPAMNVTSHLLTSVYELEACIGGKNAICDALVELFRDYHKDHFGWNKEIWDISTIAWLLNQDWVETVLVPSPILTQQSTWSFDQKRHLIRHAIGVDRNAIFRDMFQKLTEYYK